jgi:uncharacterized YccA/Bax inhibitor family protein
MSTTTFRTGNPALRESVFREAGYVTDMAPAMTIQGTAIKTLGLLGLVVAAAAFTWSQTLPAMRAVAEAAAAGAPAAIPSGVFGFVLAGLLGGFVVAMITIFMPRVSPWTAPLYAVLQGLALGGISAAFEYTYQGIVFQAVALTFGTLAVLLTVYTTGLIKVTQGFRAGVVAATGAIFLVYLVDIVLSLFGIRVPFIHETGWVGIGISVFIVVVAALNLVLDFDLIAQNASRRAPKFMEWYCGFSLLVTLVWLYLEILRLLAKLRSRD